MNLLSVLRRRRVVLPLVCLVAAVMLLISEGSNWRAVRKLDQLGEMALARANLQSLERGAANVVASQAAYGLSGRSEYRLSYLEELSAVASAADFLERRYATSGEAQPLFQQLRAALTDQLAALDASMRMIERGEVPVVDLLADESLRQRSLLIRGLCARLLELEARDVVDGRQEVYQTLQRGRIGVALLSLLAVLGLYFYLRQAGRLEQRLQQLAQAQAARLENEVALRTAELTALNNHLQTAREDERNRLARDLHDELGALLTSAKLDAARIKSRLAGSAPEALERLEHLVLMLNRVIAVKRRIGEDLRPSALSNLGLPMTLEILVREFSEQSGVLAHCELSAVRLTPSAQLVVYRLVQEAITNLTKYAMAHEVWVSLATVEDRVEVSVRDDGVGFDTSAVSASAYGLVGMRFRVAAEKGTLTVVSAPGAGTRIQVSLPQAAEHG